MPHIIVEHTGLDSKDINALNKNLHTCLSEQETVSLESIKTRSMRVENAFVGDASNNEFVHITVLLLTGRSEELKKTIAQNLFDCAKTNLKNANLKLSVNVEELGVYKK